MELVNREFRHKIRIGQKNVKEWLNQPHEHYAHKNEMILVIDEVFRKAKYIGAVSRYKDILNWCSPTCLKSKYWVIKVG